MVKHRRKNDQRVKKYIKENQDAESRRYGCGRSFRRGRFHCNASYFEKSQEEFGFSMEWSMSIMESGERRRTGMSSLWKKSAGSGRFLFSPIIIRFRNFPESGSWEKKKPEGSSENRLFRRKKAHCLFGESRKKMSVQFRVALAHNRNDLAETMLHHLARGTGIRGLSGIQAL